MHGSSLVELQFGVARLLFWHLFTVYFPANTQPIPRRFKGGKILHDAVDLFKHYFNEVHQPSYHGSSIPFH